MGIYINNTIAPKVSGRTSEFDLPLPYGGLNTVQAAKDIKDDQCTETLNKWINFEGRMSSYWGLDDVLDDSELTGFDSMVAQYEYRKDASTTYHIIAWKDSSNLHLGYISGGSYTSIDSSLTLGVIHFEQYMSINGTVIQASASATAGSSTTITDSGSGWTVDEYKGKIVHILTGTGAGQFREIKSNTSEVITVYDAWAITPDATSTYEIREIAYSLFYATADDGLKEWNGTSVISHDVGIENIRAIKIFNNIMFIAGSDDGNTIYVSRPFEPYYFEDGYADRIEKHVESISAFGVYKGNLVVFKESMNVVVQGTYDIGSGFSFVQLSQDNTRGCINHNSLVEVDGELLVQDELGVYMYGYAPNTDSVLGVQERISDNIRDIVSSATNFRGLYYNKEDDLVFMCLDDNVYALDWNRRTTGFSWWKLDIPCASCISISGETYIAKHNDDQIFKIDRSIYATTSHIKSKAYNLGTNYLKLMNHVRFFSRNISGSYVGLRVHLWTETNDVTIRDLSITLGDATIEDGGVGNDPVGNVGVGMVTGEQPPILDSLIRKVLVPPFSAYFIQIEWYNEDSNNFELDSYSIRMESLTNDHDSLSIQV